MFRWHSIAIHAVHSFVGLITADVHGVVAFLLDGNRPAVHFKFLLNGDHGFLVADYLVTHRLVHPEHAQEGDEEHDGREGWEPHVKASHRSENVIQQESFGVV